MSNYTQVTAFTPKDSLVSGNPAKIIKGSEFDSEFAAIAAAVNSKTDISTTTAELALKVTGPATTTDNAIARYDGTTGKLIQSSSATLDDSGNATFSGRISGNTVSASDGMYGVVDGFYQGYGLYNDAGNWKNTESGSGGWLWRKDGNTLSLLQGSTTGTAGTVVVPVTRLGLDASGNAAFSGKVGIGTTATPGKKLQIDAAGADAAIRLKETASYGVSWDIDVGSANEMLFTNNAGSPLNYRFNNGTATFSGNVTIGGGTLGYGAGSGGTATQPTSKSTAVTVNKPSGKITMHNAALGPAASVVFQVLNSTVGANDSVNLNANGNYLAAYVIRCAVYAGEFYVYVQNVSAGSLSEAVVINFNVIKGSTT